MVTIQDSKIAFKKQKRHFGALIFRGRFEMGPLLLPKHYKNKGFRPFLTLPPTEEIYSQPPAEWYYSSPTTLWRLKKAMYGLRASPKLWQQHLGSTTPTKSTTMQGRQVPLDYTWTRSIYLRRRLIVGWRDYKDATVHSYLEG